MAIWMIWLGIIGLAILTLNVAMTSTALAAGTIAGTEIKNQARCTYYNIKKVPFTALSNEVVIVVAAMAGVDVFPPALTRTGGPNPNRPVSYGITITNTGNAPDTFDLMVVNSLGWQTIIYFDERGDGIYDPLVDTKVVDHTDLLQPDENYKVILVVKIPYTAAPGQSADSTLTDRSRLDPKVFDQGIYTTLVLNTALTEDKSLVAPFSQQKPGDIVTYALCQKNNSEVIAYNATVTDYLDPAYLIFQSGSIRRGAVGGTYQTAVPVTDPGIAYFDSSTDTLIYHWGTVNPCPDQSCSGCLYFQATIKDALMAGTRIHDLSRLQYTLTPDPFSPLETVESGSVVFTVAKSPRVTISPSQTDIKTPGDQVVYQIEVCNLGNAVDTIALTYFNDPASDFNLTWVFWMDVRGDGQLDPTVDYKLTDTDGDGKIDIGPINPSPYSPYPPYCLQPTPILAVADLPLGIADNSSNRTTITGTSTIAPFPSFSIILTTTALAPNLTLTKEVEVVPDPNTDQPSAKIGQRLTFTITLTNWGRGLATKLVIADKIPAYTAYVPGTLYAGYTRDSLSSKTDPVDGDNGQFDSIANEVIFGQGNGIWGVIPDLPQNGTYVVRFSVVITGT